MADARTAHLLTRALGSTDPWASVEELAQDPPPELLAVAQAHYAAADASSQQRRLLAWLLEQIRDEGADRALLSLLGGAGGTDAAGLLRAAVGRGMAVPADELVRLLADDDACEAAIDIAGLSASESAWTLVPLLRRHLDTPKARGRAAIALGRMRATSCTGDLVARLPQLQGLEHEAFTVGLELMGDPAVHRDRSRQPARTDPRSWTNCRRTTAACATTRSWPTSTTCSPPRACAQSVSSNRPVEQIADLGQLSGPAGRPYESGAYAQHPGKRARCTSPGHARRIGPRSPRATRPEIGGARSPPQVVPRRDIWLRPTPPR